MMSRRDSSASKMEAVLITMSRGLMGMMSPFARRSFRRWRMRSLTDGSIVFPLHERSVAGFLLRKDQLLILLVIY